MSDPSIIIFGASGAAKEARDTMVMQKMLEKSYEKLKQFHENLQKASTYWEYCKEILWNLFFSIYLQPLEMMSWKLSTQSHLLLNEKSYGKLTSVVSWLNECRCSSDDKSENEESASHFELDILIWRKCVIVLMPMIARDPSPSFLICKCLNLYVLWCRGHWRIFEFKQEKGRNRKEERRGGKPKHKFPNHCGWIMSEG